MLILQGSARAQGHTASAVMRLRELLGGETELLDLSLLDLRPFDYDRPAQADEFDQVVERMLAHDVVIFATPVYWYAMGGRMKTLFDRFTDLLSDRDPSCRGRALAGRDIWLLAVGTDAEMPAGFEVPFARTAAYLNLRWGGDCYLSIPDADAAAERLRGFAARITAERNKAV